MIMIITIIIIITSHKTPTFWFPSSNTARQNARWRWWTQSVMPIWVPSPPRGEGSANPEHLGSATWMSQEVSKWLVNGL